LLGRAGLEDIEAADQVRGNILQRERAPDAGEHVAPVPGRGGVRQTADHDTATRGRPGVGLAAAAVRDLHAGDSLQRFDDVVVGQLADVLGDDRLDDLDRFALVLEAFGKALANAGDDHRIHRFIVILRDERSARARKTDHQQGACGQFHFSPYRLKPSLRRRAITV
jgi:hypothetical protein